MNEKAHFSDENIFKHRKKSSQSSNILIFAVCVKNQIKFPFLEKVVFVQLNEFHDDIKLICKKI
mgnify:CR=1 FL=1